jgi:MFS family permease
MTVRQQEHRVFYGWVIVAGAWLMYMLNQAAFTWGFTLFVEPLSQRFGWSRTSITVAWALSLGWGLLLAPWFGKLQDRRGARPVMLTGGLLGAAGWILMPAATSYWQFLACIVLLVGTGINGAIGPSAGSAAIAQWFKVRRSLALGIYFTGSGGAGLLLIPAMSMLVERYGWEVAALGLGGTMLAITLAVAPMMRHKPETYGLEPDGGSRPVARAGGRRPWSFLTRLPLPKPRPVSPRELTLEQALRSTAFWLFTAAIFLRYVGMGITQVHQMPHMLASGINPWVATAALSLALAINIPARIAVGWLGDLYDKNWLLNLLAIAGGFALFAFALIGPDRVGLVWFYAIFWGIGLAMLPLQAAWVADAFGRAHYGAINATSNSFALSGRLVGALGAAVVYDVLGNYTAVMMLGAAGFGIGAMLLLLLPAILTKPGRV